MQESQKRAKIFAIIGSATENSSNQKLVEYLENIMKDSLEFIVFKDLKTLPHFDPNLSTNNTPKEVLHLRESIQNADGILISTPEYVFSIPSGLKNAIEWCISTTVFAGKPTGLITASANGKKAHEELQLIMQTVMADFSPETTLLIQGIKGKLNELGEMIDSKTTEDLQNFANAFKTLLKL